MLPKLFTIGGFYLPTYGVLVAIAFLVALSMTARLAKFAGLNHESVLNLGVTCALAGIAGAKALMIALDHIYRANPPEVFTLATLQSAGIFYGGFIAALIAAYIYMRRHHLPVLRTSDVFAPGLALGHAIGRLGCFSAGCCYGLPTHLPWAVTFTNLDAQSVGVPLGIPRHPTQLYESFLEMMVSAILYALCRKRHADGQIIGLYLVLCGMVRFSVEFVRYHDDTNPLGGPFSLEQWISLVFVLAGATLLAALRRKPVLAVA